MCRPCLASSLGLAVLRSAEPLALGRWHHASAERLNKDGSLRVNGGRPVLRSSPGKSQGLNLHTLLYLGGVEPSVQLPPATNVTAHFHGCVGEVSRLPDHLPTGRAGRSPLVCRQPQVLGTGRFPLRASLSSSGKWDDCTCLQSSSQGGAAVMGVPGP